jgi:uncharacterized membrane protein
MDDDHSDYQRQRATFMAVSFTIIALFVIVVLFIFLTGGFLLYLLAAVLGLSLLGGLHYILWGRAYSESVAWEREEMEAQEQADEDDSNLPDPERPRHY